MTSPSSSLMQRPLLSSGAKPVLFFLGLAPVVWLAFAAAGGTLGANPAEAILRGLGDWTLRALCLTLAVTPLRQLTGWHVLARFRRMLGLFAFFYACLHFLAYAWLDMGLVWADIARDIAKRPFILVGTLALVLMMPLAATSFNKAIKFLGARRWQGLHRGIYIIVLLGLLHFFWMRAAKHNFAEWSVYAVLVAALLSWRVWYAVKKIR